MTFLEKVRDSASSEVIKSAIPPLLLLLTGLFSVALPALRHKLLLLSLTLLLVLLALSLLLNSITLAWILSLRKKLKRAQTKLNTAVTPRTTFGICWDIGDNPICPICNTPLRSERMVDILIKSLRNPFTTNQQLVCIKCDKKFLLLDDTGIDLSLTEAKKRLPKTATKL